jgi:hypothetical protein
MNVRAGTLPGIALLLALSGCSGDTTPTVPTGPPRPRWVPRAESQIGNVPPPFDLGRREPSVLDLPQAGFPGPWGSPQGRCGFIVNVQSNGDIYFKGNTWRPDERGFAFLREELRRLTQGAAGRSCVWMVRVDRTARWSTVRALVLLGMNGEHPLRKVRFALEGRDIRARGSDAALDADLEPAVAGAEPRTSIGLARSAADGVQVAVAGETVGFGPRDPLTDDPVALASANRAWDDVEARIATEAARGVRAARVEPAEDVPWAHVVQVLSLLHENGIVDVEVPGIEPRLHLRAEPTAARIASSRLFENDWPAGLAIGLGVAAAFAVVWLPRLLHRRPRRRRTTSASPPREA